jgi:hypothetical protein
MLSVEKFATAPVPLATAPPDQFAVLFHVPPDALVHVPLVWATASDDAARQPTAQTNASSIRAARRPEQRMSGIVMAAML